MKENLMTTSFGKVETVIEKQPLLYLDVNLGKGKQARLVVNKGDDPLYVGNKFASDNSKL